MYSIGVRTAQNVLIHYAVASALFGSSSSTSSGVSRDHGNPKPMLALTEKIKSQFGIQTDLPPVKFLYTLIKDYNHLNSGS